MDQGARSGSRTDHPPDESTHALTLGAFMPALSDQNESAAQSVYPHVF